MNIVEKIGMHSSTFTKTDSKIYDFIIENIIDIVTYDSISEFAAACGVSTSAVSRFVSKVNYSGYPQFRYELIRDSYTKASDEGPVSAFSRIVDFYKNGLDLMKENFDEDQMRRVCNMILSSRHITLCGLEASGYSAMYLASRLIKLNIKSTALIEDLMIKHFAGAADENDLFIFLSIRGKFATVKEAARLVRRQNAKLILLTSNGHCPPAEFADEVIVLPFLRESIKEYTPYENALYLVFIETLLAYLAMEIKD